MLVIIFATLVSRYLNFLNKAQGAIAPEILARS